MESIEIARTYIKLNTLIQQDFTIPLDTIYQSVVVDAFVEYLNKINESKKNAYLTAFHDALKDFHGIDASKIYESVEPMLKDPSSRAVINDFLAQVMDPPKINYQNLSPL